MAKDKKSIIQMCKVMKHAFFEKDELVFDYGSQGDLFYIVIKGKVSCKVPFFKQAILLS
jgi:CRP-like cAMP-binding protein